MDDGWSDGVRKTIAMCAAVCFVAFLVAIVGLVQVTWTNRNDRTEIRARACMQAPAAQVATCLKLND